MHYSIWVPIVIMLVPPFVAWLLMATVRFRTARNTDYPVSFPGAFAEIWTEDDFIGVILIGVVSTIGGILVGVHLWAGTHCTDGTVLTSYTCF